jgi:hypothetical protein
MIGTLLLLVALAAETIDVTSLDVSPPAAVCELDLDMIKGDVRRLSWSPDEAYLHVQTLERDGQRHDYIVSRLDGEVSLAFGEPDWAAAYWVHKSSLDAPGVPALRLEVTESHRRTRPIPFAGGGQLNGAQTPDPKNPIDAYESEVTVRLRGEEIGNWINGAPMAGETFGWGPAGTGAILFVDHRGRLTLMDDRNRKKVVASVKGAMLPAWSTAGTRVAYLQKSGRKALRVMAALVGRAKV